MAIYFVNQGKTFQQEYKGSYLWSPKRKKDGSKNSGYSLMNDVKKGDYILHNSGGKISAISIVQKDCYSAKQPPELKQKNEGVWDDSGYRIDTKYYIFDSPIYTKHLIEWARANYQENSIFQTDGKVKLRYLCEVSVEHAIYLLDNALKRQNDPELITVLDDALHTLVKNENTHKMGVFGSWEIIDENTARKYCDKSFFDHHGSGIPQDIRWFFHAEHLTHEKPLYIKLDFEEKIYSAKITLDANKRTRIFWNADLQKKFESYRDVVDAQAEFWHLEGNKYMVSFTEDITTNKKNNKNEEKMIISNKDALSRISQYISSKGFTYPSGMIENFYLSLKSKPFVILAGISGTGKTRLVKLFAEAIGAKYQMVPVRPDWSDSSDLFGHVDLNGNYIPGPVLGFISKAQDHPDTPYILCLDEMNLARVEYYLSDILSVIETRDYQDGEIVTDQLVSKEQYGTDTDALEKYGLIGFPQNLYLVGTVNMDETTFPFSRKVLDRANTIEFNFVDLIPPQLEDQINQMEPLHMPNSFLQTRYLFLSQCKDREFVQDICIELQKINEILQKGNAHVGYRVRDEIVFYMLNNKESELLNKEEALDNEIMQKILPRIQGSSQSVKDTLCDLFKEFAGDYEGYQTQSNDTASRMMTIVEKLGDQVRYPKSAKKIAFMVRRFEEDGYTSFWL